MNIKTQFNVIEKSKNANTQETKKNIIRLVNNLIIKEFVHLQNN